MTTITTRATKGSSLSWAEADANFDNLNNDKAETSVVALKAPLASPTFTGIPAAPTATTGTNTTQLATTAFVQAKTATQTPFTATGSIVATDVQAAIAEVDTDKVAKSGDTMTGQLKGITPVSVDDLARKDYVDTKLIGNGPAFSATDTTTTSSSGATVQIVFDTELFDTANAFDGTTFQPLVAGYYQVNVSVYLGVNTLLGSCTATLRKNGATLATSTVGNPAGFGSTATISEVVVMNGTTDTLDVQARNAANANIGVARFSAAYVRPL